MRYERSILQNLHENSACRMRRHFRHSDSRSASGTGLSAAAPVESRPHSQNKLE